MTEKKNGVVSIKKYRLETPEQMELRLAARRDVNLRPRVRCYTFIDLNVVSITIQASLEFLTLILQKYTLRLAPRCCSICLVHSIDKVFNGV